MAARKRRWRRRSAKNLMSPRERVRQIQNLALRRSCVRKNDRKTREVKTTQEPLTHAICCHSRRNRERRSAMFQTFPNHGILFKQTSRLSAGGDARLFAARLTRRRKISNRARWMPWWASTRADSFSPLLLPAKKLNAGFVPDPQKRKAALPDHRGGLRAGIWQRHRGDAR